MEQRWSVGGIVALVAFVSVALAPWVYLWSRGESLAVWDLAAVVLVWLVIGTFAAANSATWRKRDGK